MKLTLNKKDKKILYQLDCNARQTFSEIAKKVGLSKEVVNYRIKRLENVGVIKGYYAVVNMSRLGYICNRFFIKFRNITPQEEEAIISWFVKHPKYWWVDSSDAYRDLGVGTWEKNILECHAVRDEFMKEFKIYIHEMEHSVYTRFEMYKRAYLLDKKTCDTPVINYVNNDIVAIDSVDREILKNVAANARMPAIEIAKKLKTTISVVNYRIKKLEKNNVIETYRAMINLSKIGYSWYKVEFILKDYKKKKEMINYFAVHPNIVYTYESTAQADLELEMEVESYEKFRKVLNDIRTAFNDAIESYKHFMWYKEHKIQFFPCD